jgi:protein tyrosine phosphatase (PTP) superfamily phosphohydrolase (DUF442 family)
MKPASLLAALLAILPGLGLAADCGPAKAVTAEGVPNFFRVCAGLYRGGQPDARGFRELKRLGVRTVVNLRKEDDDLPLLKSLGLGYEHIPLEAWRVRREHAVRFLRAAADPARGPVFVHCRHGSDRTGAMVAAYRLAVCGFGREEAVAEMTKGPFGFHPIWRNLPRFVESLDPAWLRKEARVKTAGITPRAPTSN